jgi:hypothetical protein
MMATVLASCAPGGAARVVRPASPTGAAALGDACGSEAAPYVVDWPANRRGELEAALRRRGEIVVRYRCPEIEVLYDCVAPGSYVYEAFSVKEEVVRLSDADAVRARLPLAAASFEADLARGSSIDIGFLTVGRLRASNAVVFKPSLPDACQGATHVVSAVPVGAFAMALGSNAHVRTTADVFAASGGAASESMQSKSVKDGEPAACHTPSGASAPEGCRSPLRLELRALDPRTESRAACEDEKTTKACILWSDRSTSNDARHAGERAERAVMLQTLIARCQAGDGALCQRAWFDGRDALGSEQRSALVKRGCELQNGSSCSMQAEELERAGRHDEATSARWVACQAELHDEGIAGECLPLADRMLAEGRVQPATNLYAATCVHGSPEGCRTLAKRVRAGARVTESFFEVPGTIEACEREKPAIPMSIVCMRAAIAYAFGFGVPRDDARSKSAWARYCTPPKDAPKTFKPPSCEESPVQWRDER